VTKYTRAGGMPSTAR